MIEPELTADEKRQLREEWRFDDARRATIDPLRKLPTLDFARVAPRGYPELCRCPEFVIEACGAELRKICAEHDLPTSGSSGRCPCGRSFVILHEDGTATSKPET